jgi:hypothetical protein
MAVDRHGGIGDCSIKSLPFPMEMDESLKSIITEQRPIRIGPDSLGKNRRRTVEVHNRCVRQFKRLPIDLRNHDPSTGGEDEWFTLGQDLQESTCFASAKTWFRLLCEDLTNTPTGASFDDGVEIHEPAAGTYGESTANRRLP